MGLVVSSGYHSVGTGTLSDLKLIGTVPANCYLSKVDVQGYVALAEGQFSIATGLFTNTNLAAGVQYGQGGYTAAPITDGSEGGASWISWGEMMPPNHLLHLWGGTSPQTVMEELVYPLDLRWRGYRYFANTTDLYVVVGCQTSKPTFQFVTYYTYAMEAASYP